MADLQAAAVLDQVPGWAGRTRTVETLGGGITNRNYRVVVDGDTFVVRLPAERGALLGIDREVEYRASQLAAAAGVGPEVVAFLRPAGILVTRFIEGRPVSDAAVHLPDTLRGVADALRRIHTAGVVPAAFSAFRIVEQYAVTARSHSVEIPPAFAAAAAVAAEIEAALPLQPPCLCHNDLLNANFIDDGSRIRIVDWEYAGMGDRFFDLANFAVNHQLPADEERYFLEAYSGQAGPSQAARLRLMRIMSDFREAMWGVVQQGISDLDFDFRAYADKHFQRLLGASGGPAYRQWLQQAA
jgi:thiamine kinase-like enzyme